MVVGRAEPLDGAIDLIALAFEVTNLADDLMRLQPLLEIRRLVSALPADQVVDFGQGEAELLSPQNHLHAHPISGAIEAGIAFSAWLDEAAILIKSKGAEADIVEPRHLVDRKFRLSRTGLGEHLPFRGDGGCAG